MFFSALHISEAILATFRCVSLICDELSLATPNFWHFWWSRTCMGVFTLKAKNTKV